MTNASAVFLTIVSSCLTAPSLVCPGQWAGSSPSAPSQPSCRKNQANWAVFGYLGTSHNRSLKEKSCLKTHILFSAPPLKAASYCLNGCGCLGMRLRCCARRCGHAHLKAKMAFVRSFTSACSLGAGPPGGRTGSQETTSCCGAYLTFLQARRLPFTSNPPTPRKPLVASKMGPGCQR